VVRDVRQSPADADLADLYLPLLQAPGRFATIYMESGLTTVATAERVRQSISRIDPEVAIGNIRNLSDDLGVQLARPRFLTGLLVLFSLFGLLLALIGVYGLIAHSVRQREHEIAIRMAVGADSRMITRQFLKEGGVVLISGLVAGTVAAVVVARTLRSQLYGVQALDPITFVTVAFILLSLGAIAFWWPARRASKLDPISALKDH
jgi:putative ABC transport system permease protein